MEKEEIKIFMQMLCGLIFLTIASMVFWYSTSLPGFMISIIIGLVGFFLTASKMLVLYEVGLCRHIWFIVLVGFFIFLTASFVPFLCIEYVPPGFEFPKCMYVNFWTFFFG